MMYLVTWEIEIDATSPEAAAQKALKIQRDRNSIATVFTVRVFEEPPFGPPVMVDLSDKVSTCGRCGDEYSDPDGEADCPRCWGDKIP